jgi:hypothetical protein
MSFGVEIMGRLRAAIGIAVALAAIAASAPAASGEIVWSKGGDVWAMNDDGSEPRLLVSRTAVGMDGLRPPRPPAGADLRVEGTVR